MRYQKLALLGIVVTAAIAQASAQTAKPDDKGVSEPVGTIQVPAFDLPPSAYTSPEARVSVAKKIARIARLRTPEVQAEGKSAPSPIAAQRLLSDKYNFMPSLEAQREAYATTMTSTTMGGVEVQVFEPKDGVAPANKKRVIINLHGGGFVLGWPLVSQIESIPIAAVGKVKVVSVNYGLFPEAKFPRASEDVAAVYRELLKTHKPSQIGIYGCSAGGILTSASMAWFQKEKLPKPAALAIVSAALNPSFLGDSAYITPRLGSVLPAPESEERKAILYYTGADMQNPLVWPARDPKILANFPPTLLATGTRAGDMSAATQSHLELLRAGVDARLALWDGLDHCFLYDPDMPESEEAYSMIAKFLLSHMD